MLRKGWVDAFYKYIDINKLQIDWKSVDQNSWSDRIELFSESWNDISDVGKVTIAWSIYERHSQIIFDKLLSIDCNVEYV